MPVFGDLPGCDSLRYDYTPPEPIPYGDRPVPEPWDGSWLPKGALVAVGCYRIGCHATGWKWPGAREICHCGDYMDDHGHPMNVGHNPVSMGVEPTLAGEFEGWCPDHGYWWIDQEGEVRYQTVITDHDPGDQHGR